MLLTLEESLLHATPADLLTANIAVEPLNYFLIFQVSAVYSTKYHEGITFFNCLTKADIYENF